MIVKKNVILESKNKKPILCDLFYKKSGQALPMVIFCHGYKGFKDWGAWNLAAEKFAEAGFAFLKFNFSHNGGTVEQPVDFPDPEAFATNNYSLELDDLDRVLNFTEREGAGLQDQKIGAIYLIGHSRGGGVALLKANEDPRIKKVVTWAAVSDLRARFFENTPEFRNWKKTGITYVENKRTSQMLPHYYQFYEDFIANKERFDIQKAVSRLSVPLLILHGNEDTTVKLEEAEALHRWSSSGRLEIIPKADHVFGTAHPWEKEVLPDSFKIVIEKSIDFLKNVAD